MIRSKSAVVKDMDSFIAALYDNKVLTSNTFTRIENQVDKVLKQVNETFLVLQQAFLSNDALM